MQKVEAFYHFGSSSVAKLGDRISVSRNRVLAVASLQQSSTPAIGLDLRFSPDLHADSFQDLRLPNKRTLRAFQRGNKGHRWQFSSSKSEEQNIFVGFLCL